MADIGTSEPVRAFSRQFQVDQIPAGGLNDRIEASEAAALDTKIGELRQTMGELAPARGGAGSD